MALESLIKSWWVILLHLNKLQFKDFPTSLYVAKKMLNIFQPKMQLVVYTECHKLYNVKYVIAYKEEGKVTVINCLHKEFSNNSHSHQCNNTLSVLKKNKDAIIAISRMLYPKPSIRQQLNMLYQQPGFENMLK